MQLIRIGNAYARQEQRPEWIPSDYGNDKTDKTVLVDFSRFGNGTERTSDFLVRVSWADVQGLIQEFAQMGHPDAGKLQSAVKLADAAETAGWTAEATQQSN